MEHGEHFSLFDRFLNPTFYSLVALPIDKVKRHCLRCRKEFSSMHHGNRCCSICSSRNAREAIKAEGMIGSRRM